MTASYSEVHHGVFDMDGIFEQTPFEIDEERHLSEDYGFFEDIDVDDDPAAALVPLPPSDDGSACALPIAVCGARIADDDDRESPPIITQCVADTIADRGLPWAMQDTPWERLFASSRDGQSFSTFMRRVRGHGQTIVVARTSDGRVIGGYATDVWSGRKQPVRTQDEAGHAFLFVVAERPAAEDGAAPRPGDSFIPGLGELGTSPTSAFDFDLHQPTPKRRDDRPRVDIFKPSPKQHASAGGGSLKQACQMGNKCISMTDENGDLSLVIESSFSRGVACTRAGREEFTVVEFEVYGFSED